MTTENITDVSKTEKTNSSTIALGASLSMTPATFAATWAFCGATAPEIVLPLTAIIMACTAVSSYFSAAAFEEMTKEKSSNLKPDKTPQTLLHKSKDSTPSRSI